MKSKFDGFIWGLILLVAGGLFMARNLGYEVELTPADWILICSGLSALCLIRYLVGDLKQWGRLMPACQFAAFAVMIQLAQSDVTGSIIAAPLFIGFMLPFVVALVADRQQNYWAIIPASIFGMLTMTTLFGEGAGEFFAACVMLLIAAPFCIIYLTRPQQWWALIPAGILGTIGLTALVGALIPALDDSILLGTVFFLGFAATFGLLYLRRGVIPTEWAKVPAIVFSGIALLILMGSIGVNAGALILIALGVTVLYTSLRQQRLLAS